MSRRTVSTTLLTLAFLCLLGAAPPAQAQTPAATIKNGNGTVRWQTFYDGGLLAPGNFGPTSSADSIPAEGAGTRMMWYPAKAAFRAGRVGVSSSTEDNWNASNVGDNSVAFGKDPKASGDNSVAMGENTTAKNRGAVAMGINTTAGNDASILAATGAVAMGDETTASGPNAVAMGFATTAGSYESFAAGARAAAEDERSFVWNDGSGYHGIPNAPSDGLSSGTQVNGGPTGAATFSVSAQGGVRFITGSSSVTYISGGSAGWSNTSARSAKTDIGPVDPTAVLAAVQEMPISTWEYKTESGGEAGTRHIGPMAGDFHGALPYDLGSSEDHINSINADGVALGAVKGLAQKVERQQAIIDSLRERVRQIESVEERLASLEAERGPAAAGWTGELPLRGLGFLLVGGLLGAGLVAVRRS